MIKKETIAIIKSPLQAVFAIIVFFGQGACTKLVQIKPPSSTITTGQVFADSADANAAILGIYSNMLNINDVTRGFGAIYCGMSADELKPFYSEGDQFSANSITSTNSQIQAVWSSAYTILYQANASIEGLQSSRGLQTTAATHFIAEARFIRAFINFYLVNLFGDIPYVTGSDYNVNALLARTPKSQVYDSIISDLKFARINLPDDYSYSAEERVRVNRACASAVLARVYLYLGDWSNAETYSTEIITNGNYTLASTPDEVFGVNNAEAILQWKLNPGFGNYNATYEGMRFVPFSIYANPNYYLRPELLNVFEANDLRKTSWINSTNYGGTEYYYPYKYKVGPGQQDQSGATPITQYYMVLRVTEQYLIRAEAEANGAGDGLLAAVTDLNLIRNRAGLPAYSGAMDQNAVLSAIYRERRVEFFAEWGHRWFDLKRSGMIDTVLKAIKPQYQPYMQLFPIPFAELQTDPNLTQNPGYH